MSSNENEMQLTAAVSLTPEQVAQAFWQMGSDGQADFFAALERMAGFRLCLRQPAALTP